MKVWMAEEVGRLQTIVSWVDESVRSLAEENFIGKDSIELDSEKTK